MADNARMTHVSPGVYSREIELTYAVKSLGITSLGLVGETLKGPAFQPITIENWRDFISVFGGTSAEKFLGSKYPKYELPYIAKSYLSESNRLQVCRVLGLSGYNAGPAWVITATSSRLSEKIVVAVLRSRGKYHDYFEGSTISRAECGCSKKNIDYLEYNVGDCGLSGCSRVFQVNRVKLNRYEPFLIEGGDCNNSASLAVGRSDGSPVIPVNPSDYGRFTIEGIANDMNSEDTIANTNCINFKYAVSLNPNDPDYILKVLGTNPTDSNAHLYVESLYDVAYQEMVNNGTLTGIDTSVISYKPLFVSEHCLLKDVNGIMTINSEALSRKHVGKRYLYDGAENMASTPYYLVDYTTKQIENTERRINKNNDAGQIFTVRQYTDNTGKRKYVYTKFNVNASDADTDEEYMALDKLKGKGNEARLDCVKNLADGMYYTKISGGVEFVTCDLNNYIEQYRFGSTPWLVSNVKGEANNIEVNKLLRFHTISDGDSSNNEIKVSIANISLDEGYFDVLVRDINDTDANQIVYEAFRRCSLTLNSKDYVAYKIGSFDGVYEPKSKFITVEVNDNLVTSNSIPCGFIGYPMQAFNGVQIDGTSTDSNIAVPDVSYNLNVDDEIRYTKQYFGLSDRTGVDIDMFTYKGYNAYAGIPAYLSTGFHLDCRIGKNNLLSADTAIYVDGESGYKFNSVSINNTTDTLSGLPVIGTEEEMANCIFKDKTLRKFTVYFYGGFDGWDIYRNERSNTDKFKLTNYRGFYNTVNGNGYSLNKLSNPAEYDIDQQANNSDFYAYLSAIRKFSNPESIDINVFATPGIDLTNHTALSKEVIKMIEEERADSIYVAVTPDKPSGSDDYVSNIYTAEDVVGNLEITEIDSNYTCTYYPWIKYEDVDNGQYVFVSPTKDVVRNMAITDNTSYPWFAPAGMTRGSVNCVGARYVTKLADEDTLYDGRINPVKTFASDGVKIWGQKNLQRGDGQLTRIAVRRLLLRMRKLIAIACNGLIFEPNDVSTKNRFMSVVTPIMDNIKSNRGISDYRVEVNDTLESRERRELPAKIFFKPYNALEYITLDFIVTPEGLSFDAI